MAIAAIRSFPSTFQVRARLAYQLVTNARGCVASESMRERIYIRQPDILALLDCTTLPIVLALA